MLSSQIIMQCTLTISSSSSIYPYSTIYHYILKISIHGMRNFNGLVCNKYEARSAAVVVSQYSIAHYEKKSKDTSSSQILFINVRNYSG